MEGVAVSRHMGNHVRPSFLRCAREGFYFCKDCQRVVQRVDHDYLPGRCAECGSVRVHWNPPVLADGHYVLKHPHALAA
jgi:DNA-directed RNA polymerase subunit RPC12/RpoP